MNPEKCQNCYYFKPREADPETNELAWGNWCLQSGMPIRIEEIAGCKIAEIYAERKREASGQIKLDL